jgi:hypothetical protein
MVPMGQPLCVLLLIISARCALPKARAAPYGCGPLVDLRGRSRGTTYSYPSLTRKVLLLYRVPVPAAERLPPGHTLHTSPRPATG